MARTRHSGEPNCNTRIVDFGCQGGGVRTSDIWRSVEFLSRTSARRVTHLWNARETAPHAFYSKRRWEILTPASEGEHRCPSSVSYAQAV